MPLDTWKGFCDSSTNAGSGWKKAIMMLTEIPASKEFLEKIRMVSVKYNRLC